MSMNIFFFCLDKYEYVLVGYLFDSRFKFSSNFIVFLFDSRFKFSSNFIVFVCGISIFFLGGEF